MLIEEPTRILMAEDLLTDARLAEREINRTLKACLYRRVETREDFVAAIVQFQPDIILSDYHMPLFDGMEALKLAIEYTPLTPVIILTGALNEDTAVECMKAGAADYVIKEHIKRLGQAVIHALEQKNLRLEQHRAQQALRESEERYRTLAEAANDIVYVLDRDGVLQYINPYGAHLFNLQPKDLIGLNLPYFFPPSMAEDYLKQLQNVLETGEPGLDENPMTILNREIWLSTSLVPLGEKGERARGVMGISRDITERIRAERALRESEAQYRARTQELETLFTLSSLLRQALTAEGILQVVLGEIRRVLVSDTIVIILLDSTRQHFRIALAEGKLAPPIGQSFSVENNSLSQQVLISGKPYVTSDFALDPHRMLDDAQRYHANLTGPAAFIPLQSENEILGVLMLSREKDTPPGPFSPEEVRLLSVVGEMAGNALRRAWLFEDLQRSNIRLSLAYDDTIEALSRALDLRDKETEGHTLRVINLTVQMARKLGVEVPKLEHIRRGALLHDIGKIGIPDVILLKPGHLTAAEWEIMRRHPQYAFDMLSPIEYLHPATEIPYCHHEKWNGTGYPRRLKGAEIPIEARLFAVVDVWDALTSERPYRPAWSKELALRYIRDQAGQHFDPQVVEIFLEIVPDLPDQPTETLQEYFYKIH